MEVVEKGTSLLTRGHETRLRKTGEVQMTSARILRNTLRFATSIAPAWLGFVVVGLSTPAAGQQPGWQQIFPSPFPSPRYGHAMAYDFGRGVTVLFGGYNNDSYNGETWEWNGSAWTLRASSGPSPRSFHAMAYDAGRGVTVLFGGYNNGTSYGETWEWNGSAWTPRSSSGPSPRFYHAMAYDAGPGVTVLFGGYNNGTSYGETWEWNGSAWTLRSSPPAAGPSPRWGHAMVYDAARGVIELFGGYASSYSGETWEWNGSAWMLRSNSGPSPRYGHAMAYDAGRGVTVLFGGLALSGYNGQTWEWDGSAWTLRSSGGPSPRYVHAMAHDAVRRVTVQFGGFNNGTSYGDTWEWNGSAWTLRSASGPSARFWHAMSHDAGRGVTVMFGGYYYDGLDRYLGETWEWNGSAWMLRSSSGPAPRGSLAMAYDAGRRVTLMFGGHYYDGIDHYLGDTWEWNGSAWTLRSSTGPSPRYGHAMAYDAGRGVTVLFGGHTASGYNG